MHGPPNELRRNPLTGRWVTIASGRASRPQDFATRVLDVESEPGRACPFCPGNEDLTPPAIASYDHDGGWLVRVVPNKFPAFAGTGAMHAELDGILHQRAPATGAHEVLVIGPEHGRDIALVDDPRIDAVGGALLDRFAAHAARPEIHYTQAIVNIGREAGASLEHPHAQLLGIPFVPREIDDELAGFAGFARAKGDPDACLLCTTIEVERAEGRRVVLSDDDGVVITPYWSGAPYEMLLLPRHHGPRVGDGGTERLRGAGRLLRDAIALLRQVLGNVAYNVVVHTAPHRLDVHYHWHLHLLPRTSTLAGFEQGTGVLINTMSPEDAARHLTHAASAGAAARGTGTSR